MKLIPKSFGCHVCHGAMGEDLVGPSPLFSPTPVFEQLERNSAIGVILGEMDPSVPLSWLADNNESCALGKVGANVIELGRHPPDHT